MVHVYQEELYLYWPSVPCLFPRFDIDFGSPLTGLTPALCERSDLELSCATLLSLLCHSPLLSQVSLVSKLLSSPFSPNLLRAPEVSSTTILS